MVELAVLVFADQVVPGLLQILLVMHNSLVGQKWQLHFFGLQRLVGFQAYSLRFAGFIFFLGIEGGFEHLDPVTVDQIHLQG